MWIVIKQVQEIMIMVCLMFHVTALILHNFSMLIGAILLKGHNFLIRVATGQVMATGVTFSYPNIYTLHAYTSLYVLFTLCFQDFLKFLFLKSRINVYLIGVVRYLVQYVVYVTSCMCVPILGHSLHFLNVYGGRG